MPKFNYKAVKPQSEGGGEVKGTLEASSAENVMEYIQTRGLFPIEIKEVATAEMVGAGAGGQQYKAFSETSGASGVLKKATNKLKEARQNIGGVLKGGSDQTVGEARQDGSLPEVSSALSKISEESDETNQKQETKIDILREIRGFVESLVELKEKELSLMPTASEAKEDENEKKKARIAGGTRKDEKGSRDEKGGGLFSSLLKGFGDIAKLVPGVAALSGLITGGMLKVGLIGAAAIGGFLVGNWLYDTFFKATWEGILEADRLRQEERGNQVQTSTAEATQIAGPGNKLEDAFTSPEGKAIPRSEMEKRVEAGESQEDFKQIIARKNVETGEYIDGVGIITLEDQQNRIDVFQRKQEARETIQAEGEGGTAIGAEGRSALDETMFDGRFMGYEKRISQFLKYYSNDEAAEDAESGARRAYYNAFDALKMAHDEAIERDDGSIDIKLKSISKFPLLSAVYDNTTFNLDGTMGIPVVAIHTKIDRDNVMDGQTLYFKTLDGWRSRGTPAELAGYPELEKPESGTALKLGGLVTRPTRALIGEAGAELVLPLQQAATFIASVLTSMVNTGAPIMANAKSGLLAADMMTNSSLSSGGSATVVNVNNSSNPTVNTSNSLSVGGSGTSPNMNNISYLRTKSRRSNSEMF